MAFLPDPSSPNTLGGPPPSPTPMGGLQGNAPFSLSSVIGQLGSIPANKLPPEVLTGITASAQQIGTMLDSFAQITPDKAAQLATIKDMLQSYLADLMTAGSQPISPTATGPAFPGGGMDRGVAGAGTV